MPRKKTTPPPPPEFDDQPEDTDQRDDSNFEPDENGAFDDPDAPEGEPGAAAALPEEPEEDYGRLAATRHLPPYLLGLAGMHGVESVVWPPAKKMATAWVFVTNTHGRQTHNCPLAFLAPDAIFTLGDLGFEGHTSFELKDGPAGATLAYFACELPELPEPEAPPELAGADANTQAIMRQLARQEAQIQALAARAAAPAAQVDPLAQLEKSLETFGRLAQHVVKLMPQAAPAAPAGTDYTPLLGKLAEMALPRLFGQQAEAPTAEAGNAPQG